MAGYPLDRLTGEVKCRLEKANKDDLAFITPRPDQWNSHYNMGNYRLRRADLKEAVVSYKTALKVEPTAVMPMVNSSIAYAQMGEPDKAEKSLLEALKTSPDNAAANFNISLVTSENEHSRK